MNPPPGKSRSDRRETACSEGLRQESGTHHREEDPESRNSATSASSKAPRY